MAHKTHAGDGGMKTWLRQATPVGGGILVLALFVYWATRPSLKTLLDVAAPTPEQIRTIASVLLLDDDFSIRSRASAKLTALGQAAVPVLKELAATHPDPAVRKAVLDLLTGLDPKSAAEIVVQLSRDKNVEVQRTAVSVAARLDDSRSLEVLQQGVQSEDGGVRQAAVEGLGARREASAVSALESALKDPNITVRRHAARALQLITGKNYNNQVRPPD